MKTPFELDLGNEVAVVTGGYGTLGSAFVKALAKCGADIFILGRNPEKGKDLLNQILEEGIEADILRCDVLKTEDLKKARQIIKEDYGKKQVDILINCAGGNHPDGTTSKEYFHEEDLEKEDVTTFFNLDKKGFRHVFDLNFVGTFLTTQVFAKDMIESDTATVINISSMNAFTPLTKIPAYSGAKAAVSNFTKWLAVYFSQVNIRVNAIAPGFYLTEQNKELLLNDNGSYTDRAQKILNHTPMGRFGEKEDLVGTLLWLVSKDCSGFVNGTVVPVDGGFSAYSGV